MISEKKRICHINYHVHHELVCKIWNECINRWVNTAPIRREATVCHLWAGEGSTELRHIDDLSVSFIPNFFPKRINGCYVWCNSRLSLHSHFFTMLLFCLATNLRKHFWWTLHFYLGHFLGEVRASAVVVRQSPLLPKPTCPTRSPTLTLINQKLLRAPLM